MTLRSRSIIFPSCFSQKSAVASRRRVAVAATKTHLSFTTISNQSSSSSSWTVHPSFASRALTFATFTRPSLLIQCSTNLGPPRSSTPHPALLYSAFAFATMTTKTNNEDDNKQETATSPSTTAVESANSESDSVIVDELAQAVGKIHVSEVVDEPEEMPEALRKVASWIMDGTVKNILVLTGAGVRYVCVCLCVVPKR
jgi:hypothetical protein